MLRSRPVLTRSKSVPSSRERMKIVLCIRRQSYLIFKGSKLDLKRARTSFSKEPEGAKRARIEIKYDSSPDLDH